MVGSNGVAGCDMDSLAGVEASSSMLGVEMDACECADEDDADGVRASGADVMMDVVEAGAWGAAKLMLVGSLPPTRLRMAASSARRTASSASRALFCCWRSSISTRFRSRELCAARRLRLTRSMRRCSFSSSVFARLRGGRLVFGSGSTWPQDFLFLTGLDSLEDDGVPTDGDDAPGARREGSTTEGVLGVETSSICSWGICRSMGSAWGVVDCSMRTVGWCCSRMLEVRKAS